MAVFNPLNPMENVTPKFTEEQLTEIVTWFDENAKPLLLLNDVLTPVITIEQLQTFMGLRKIHRRSFHTPSYAELMNTVEQLKMEKYRMLIKDQFIYFLNKFYLEPDMKHEMALAFKVFDTEERSFLEEDLVRDILSTLGHQPFEHEETIEFIRDADVRGDGNIRYEEFVETIFKLAPELIEVPKEYVYEDPDEDPSVPPLPAEPEPQPLLLQPPPPPPPPEPEPQEGAATN